MPSVHHEESYLAIFSAFCLPLGNLLASNSDGENVDELKYFKYDNNSSTYIYVIFMYSDRDVTITGSEDDFFAELSLQKGWNNVFVTQTRDKDTWATKAVSGLKWHFVN